MAASTHKPLDNSYNCNKSPLEYATPAQIRSMRIKCGYTQQQAAHIVHRASANQWASWESDSKSGYTMPLDTLELFLIKSKLRVMYSCETSKTSPKKWCFIRVFLSANLGFIPRKRVFHYHVFCEIIHPCQAKRQGRTTPIVVFNFRGLYYVNDII